MRALLCFAVALLAAPASGLSRPAVRGAHGMVASSSDLASEAGVQILKRGGNAVDAAVAVALALAVTHPSAGNLGGGGFMVVRMADGRETAIDYRETAPLAATQKMYLDEAGNVVPEASTVGYRGVGVPGTVAGLALALQKYGTMKWSVVVQPALELARRGFVLSKPLADDLRAQEPRFAKFAESHRIFNRSGRPYAEGERFMQPELAQTLGRLARGGPREFYEGKTAELLVRDMVAHGGLITRADLTGYRAIERKLLHGRYRGYEVLTMPPPSSGGATLLQELNILEGYELQKLPQGSAASLHLELEAMRRAFADRALFFGDPDFVQIPLEALTSRAYAARQRANIDPLKATPSSTIAANRPAPTESDHTTHFTIVDAAGNAVSNTFTLNLAFGSGATVTGAGFLLNDEMDDFTSKPGTPNAFGLIQGEANAIAPRKRPLSSMTPTLLLKDGKLVLALGSPGGPTIINTVLQVLLDVVDFHMELQAAVDAPRVHQQWMPDLVMADRGGLNADTQAALAAMGYAFLPPEKPVVLGDVEAVMIEPGTSVRLGASDPRGGDSRAVGY
jgi:gamma-glutamyltranspeptidase/glutathione hydrolase